MATVKLWAIKSRLDVVLGYATNEDKVTSNEYINLKNALDYASGDSKTENKQYVSTLNCGVSTAYEEMKITKERWNKKTGIIGFHGYQSFKGDEVTPEVAHSIGIKLANEIWGDKFEVIITTHLDTDNVHNHFVVNSVSCIDGKKYYASRTTYANMRAISDEICEEYGISVLKEKTSRKSGINYSAYNEKYKEHNNYYTETKKDIDTAISQANTYRDFENILRVMKYELIYRAGVLSVRRFPYKKNIRVHRSFGEDYTKEAIIDRIQKETINIDMSEKEVSIRKYYSKFSDVKKEKAKGLYGLYLHYCYLLKVFPVKYPKKVLSAEMKAEIKLMDKISNQTIFLVTKEIKTDSELLEYKVKNSTQLNEWISTRINLWKRYNRSTNENEKIEIRSKIDILSKDINKVRKEVEICDEIIDRLDVVRTNIEKHYEVEKRKER